jgi:hypothetical protein
LIESAAGAIPAAAFFSCFMDATFLREIADNHLPVGANSFAQLRTLGQFVGGTDILICHRGNLSRA